MTCTASGPGLGWQIVTPAPDIPGHTVTSVLGTGGFAAVYRGWQRAVGREVAIKIDNRVLFSERDRRRFFREVTAAGRLSGHPHVVDVYDAGMLGDGRPYLVMELCPGGSLNDELRRYGPMSPQRVTSIGVRLADALAAAHAAGVLHRDIKPANILINRYGVVGLADFGLASIIAASGEQTVTREALTPAFAPPESFRGEEPTAAADIYSLAATLYMLLAGRPPRFPAGEPSPGLATIAVLHDRPVEDVPGAPPELMAILRQSLAADPAQRPPTAAALRDALAALDLPGGPPTPARHPTAISQPAPGQPPVSGGSAPAPYPAPAPLASWAADQALAPQASWVPDQAPAPQASWAADQAPAPQASWVPDQAPAPQASWVPDQAPARPASWASGQAPPQTSGPAPVGATPGRDMGVPATGDYWSPAGPLVPSGHGTEGTSPSWPGTPAGPSRPGTPTGPTGRTGSAAGPTGPAAHPARAGASQPGSYPGAGPTSHPGTGLIPNPGTGPIPHPGSRPGSHPGTGLAGQPGPAGPATQPPTVRRRPVALTAALTGGLVLVVVAALFAGAHFFAPGRTPGGTQPRHGASAAGPGTDGVAAVFGVPTVTSGCPAASAGTSGARCPSSPECWNGIVAIAGDTTARSLPCTGPHVWETFAIGILPAAASTSDAVIVAKNPTVRSVCSVSVLLRSRAGAARRIPAASWDIEVVPPDEAAYDSGARAYRCLAHVLTGPDPAESQFVR
jgi:serine/threonine protein kinase